MIDTLKYSRELEAAGFTADQAELFVRSQVGMITDNVATKVDIRESLREVYDRLSRMDHRIDKLEQSMESRFQMMEKSMNTLFRHFQSSFELQMKNQSKELTIRTGLIVGSFFTLFSTGFWIVSKFVS